MKQRLPIAGVIVLLLSLLFTLSACQASSPADGTAGDRVIFGGTQTITSDTGDLAVFGGNVTIGEDAKVNGDVAVFGGTLTNKGKIYGDVALFGSAFDRREGSSHIGQLLLAGASMGPPALSDSPPPPPGAGDPNQPDGPDEGPQGPPLGGPMAVVGSGIKDLIAGVATTFLKVIAFGAVGLGLALFLPEHVRRVGQTAGEAPLASTGIGCLGLLSLPVLALLLLFTIIGVPILAVAVPMAWIFGWIGLGYFFGNRLLRAADIRSPRPAAATAIGSAGLFLLSSLVGVLPVIGWLVFPLLSIWAFGATILSLGGTRSYPFRTRFATASASFYRGNPQQDTPSPPPAQHKPANDLFADLAADLGIEEELDQDDEEEDQPDDAEDRSDPPPPDERQQ